MIAEGERAPDFSLPDQDGSEVSLTDFAGKTVVLYFYPKADTPGCTAQACGIRDHSSDDEAAGAVVLGVSADPVDAVKRFHDRYSLNFTLLADADHVGATSCWKRSPRRPSCGREGGAARRAVPRRPRRCSGPRAARPRAP